MAYSNGLPWDGMSICSSSGGGGWNPAYAVDTFADLPAYADHIGEYWLVDNETLTPSSAWYNPFKTKNLSGIYKATVTGWNYKGIDTDEIPVEYDYYVTANSWADLVSALESGTYATVFIPDGTYTCTDNEASPLVIHANVKRMDGQSMEGTIINANCAVNTSIVQVMTIPLDTVVSNIQLTNIGTAIGFLGTRENIGILQTKRATKVFSCVVSNLLDGAVGFQYCTPRDCKVVNNSSVGTTGLGFGFSTCYYMETCSAHYCYRGIYNCKNVLHCDVDFGRYGISYSDIVIGCSSVDNPYRGIVSCREVDFCRSGSFYSCTNMGRNNTDKYYNNASVNYNGCTFNHTERDNTDNTKLLTHDYSSIATGTEREVTWQDKDGTVALLDDCGGAYGNTLVVAKSGAPYSTIQSAINASTSSDIIQVMAGTYTEALTSKAGGTTTIEGDGVMGSVIIQHDTATVLTVPMTGIVQLKNVKLKSTATGLNASKLVDMNGIVGLFNKVYFDFDVNDGSNSAVINVPTGTSIFSDCKYDFTSTGTSGAINNFIATTGTARIQLVRGYAKMSISAITSAEHLHFLNDDSTSDDAIHYMDCRLSAGANFAGDIDFIHTTGGGEIEVQSTKIKITTTGAVAGSYGQVYHLAGSAGSHIHSTGNRMEITGFADNLLGNIEATETLYSHFDDIVADGGVIGAGTYSYANSPSNGNIQMSGFLIRKVIDITADYDDSEAWEFGILNLASTTTTDATVTVKTTAFSTAPSGATRTFLNSSDTYNMILDTNGMSIGGSTNDRVIYPNGYIVVEKMGNRGVITGSYNTSFNIEISSIANPSFHVDFSDASSVTVDGSNHITNVVEKVNSWNGTPSSITGVAYGSTTQNGLNTALWDTSNTPLSFGDNDIHNNTAGRGMTIIAIVKANNTGDAIMSKYHDTTPQREWRFYSSNITIYSALDASGQEGLVNYSSNYGEWQVLQMEWVPGGKTKAYKNGFAMGVSSYDVTAIPAGTADLLMGASDGTGADFYGEVGEIYAFSGTMTDDERIAVTSKFGAKWDIDTAVPSASDSSPFGRNSDNDTISPLIIGDHIETSGYITGRQCGVFAYLGTATTTTCALADTWYPITGTFTNPVLEDFSSATVVTPGIKYDGEKTQYFEVDYHAMISADENSTTVHLGVKKNGTIVAGSVMGSYSKEDDEEKSVSGTCVIELAEDDEIQLVVMADDDGDVISVEHYTTTISRFSI